MSGPQTGKRPRPKITADQADVLWRMAAAVGEHDPGWRKSPVGPCTAQHVLDMLVNGLGDAIERSGSWEREIFEGLFGEAIDRAEKRRSSCR